MSSIDRENEANEIDIFLYGKSLNAEELLLALLKGDSEVINYGNLSFDEKIKAALTRYMKECTQNPERVVFYATKLMANETITTVDAWNIFQEMSYIFPPTIPLMNLEKEDCKKLIELFPTTEKFKSFFDEKIITHPEVQEEIAFGLKDPEFTKKSQLNWHKYYKPRQEVQKILLN